MKRILILFILLTGAALIFAQSPQALIRETTGTVELKKSGSADWTMAKAGDTLEKATIISTGFKSTATLTIGDSTLSVRPLTRLSLDELLIQDNVEMVNVGLSTGRMRVNVNPPAGHSSDFTVKTPMATASVRGTEFIIDPVSLHVIEGAVLLDPSGDGRAVTVSAGQDSGIDTETGKAANPLDQAEADRGLPALAGQTAAPATEGSTVQAVPKGTVAIELVLEK